MHDTGCDSPYSEEKADIASLVGRQPGDRDRRDVYCVQPSTNGSAFSWWGTESRAIVNGSIPYRGGLAVRYVPRGSVWSLTLSDVPSPRTADADIPPSDRRAGLEQNMFPRQLGAAARA